MTKSESLIPTMARRVDTLAAWLLALAFVAPAAAQPQEAPLEQMFHQAWGIRDGAPGAITSIAESPDGHLWLTSPAGVYRFDGARFEMARFPGPRIRRPSSVWTFDDGSLWILHERGQLSRIDAGERTTFGAADGLPGVRMLALARDHQGVMWAAGELGLARLSGARWQMVVPARAVLPPSGASTAVLADSRGALWASTGGELLVRRPGREEFTRHASFGARRLAESPEGAVWALLLPGRELRVLETPEGRTGATAVLDDGRHLAFDHTGGLYIATGRGLARVSGATGAPVEGGTEHLDAARGLTHDSALTTLVDREGNVWVGTAAGLDLLRATVVTPADPLPPVHAARLTRQGDDVWVGSRKGLTRVRGKRLQTTLEVPVTGVLAERAGTVVAWGGGALWRGEDGVFRRIAGTPRPQPDEAWHFAADAAGRLWAGFLRTGIWCLEGDRWVRPTVDGLDLTATSTVFADQHGRIWLSSVTGDVIAVSDGGAVRLYAGANRLSIGQLVGLAAAPHGTWIAGRDGIAVVADGGDVRPVPGIDEDTVGAIRGIATGDDDSVWLNADHGIVRIAAAEARRAVGPTPAPPRYRVFDHLDGMVGGAAPRPANAALRAPDGRMWFVGYDAVYAVDPTRLSGTAAPPPVRVTSLRAGDRDYAASNGLVLALGSNNVRVSYTGLSLTMPDRIRFRHRLDGIDDAWQDAGARREAFYANLAPGRYTFRVMASNNNGVWPETGATTTFVVPPALHQTAAFRVTALAVLTGAIWAAFRLRVRQVTAALRGQHAATVAERERIARELHDTLLQSVQGLILRFQAVALRLPSGDDTARSMEETLTRADDVLAEARSRVRDLRRSTEASADLAHAVAALGADLVGGTPVAFTATVEGAPVPLHPVVRDEAYWIVHEAVSNAVRHSGAQRIEAEIAYGSGRLSLRCRDDGRGIGTEVAVAGKAEHFGLRGMRERAAKIGGELRVWSREGAGTEVELSVPAGTAYARIAPARWSWLHRLVAPAGES